MALAAIMSLAVVLLILALANVQLAKAAPSIDFTEISSTDKNVKSSTEAGTENVLAIWTEDESTTKTDISGKPDNSEQTAVEKPPDYISSDTTEKLNSNPNQEGDSEKVPSYSKNDQISGQQVELASDTNSSKNIQNDTDSEVESSISDSLDPEYLDFDSSIPDPLNSDSQNTESSNLDTINPDPSKSDSSKTDSTKTDSSNPDVLNRVSSLTDNSDSDSSNTDPSKPAFLDSDSSNPETLNTDHSKQNTLKPEPSNADESKASDPDRSNPDSSKADSFISDSSDPESLKTDSANPDLSNPDSSNPDLSNPDSSNPEPLKPESFSPNPVPSNTDAIESTNPDSSILNYPSSDSNLDKSDSSGNCDCDRPEKPDSLDSSGIPDTCKCPKEPEKSTITDTLVKSDSLDNFDSQVKPNKPEKSNELENSNRLDKLAKKDANNSENTVSTGIEIDEELDTPASDDAGQKESSDDDSEILAPGETDFPEFSTETSFPLPLGVISWIPPPFMRFAPIFPQSPFDTGYQQMLSPSFPPTPFDLGFPLAGLGFLPINGFRFPQSAILEFPPLPSSPYVSDASIVSGLRPLNSPIFSKLFINVGSPLIPNFEDLEYSEERLFVCCS